MKKAVFLLFMTFSALQSWGQSTGQTEYDFLRLPVSAHASAVGGDNISMVENDPSLMFSNPALLLGTTPKTIGINYMNYMSGCNYASASYNMVFDEKWNVGIGAQYMNYGSMKHTSASNEDLGTFTASDLAIGGTLAYELLKNVSGGITAKMIYGKIGSYSSMAFGVDLGVNYYDPEREWSLSLVAKNLGGQVKAYDETFERMPIDVQIGVSKQVTNTPFRLHVTAVDLNHWDYKAIDHLVFGVDVLLSDQFYIAGGYNLRRAHDMKVANTDGDKSSHGAGLSLGAGINLDRFKINVAYSKFHVSSNSLIANIAFNI